MTKYLRIMILLLVIHNSVGLVNFSDESGIDNSGLEPTEYSSLIKKVAKELNIKHLGITKENNKKSYQGIIWGIYSRALVALPVRLGHNRCKTKINMIFRVDPASPVTWLNRESIQALYDNCPSIKPKFWHSYSVKIAGQWLYTGQTKGVCILGADFMRATNALVTIKYSKTGKGFTTLEFQPYGENSEVN